MVKSPHFCYIYNMGITKSKGHKEINDKFYTHQSVAKMCIDMIDLSSYDIIVEPSAGNGSFSNQIPNCISYDLVPEHPSIIQQDYLKLDTWRFMDKKVLTIGNPPFGIQNNLAIQFFNKAAEYSHTIAFILPRTFMKESIQNKLDENFHLVKCVDLSKDSFLLNGETYDVPCVFQIWERNEDIRRKSKFVLNNHLIEFVKGDDYDFVVHRVGGSAGKAFIPENGMVVSKQSNYFIKNKSNYSNETLVNMINEIEMTTADYSVGPKSISKKELMNYILKEERQKAGFDFEVIIEKLFANIKRNKPGSKFDGVLKYGDFVKNCSIKHSVSSSKKYIELADLQRNVDNDEDYILFNGIDSNDIPKDISIHFFDKTIKVSNNFNIKLSDIYVYHIYQDQLKINDTGIKSVFDKCVDYGFTKCMDIDKGLCDFNDRTIFKHNRDTSTRTIMKVLVDESIMGRYDLFDRNKLKLYNGIVVYEPVEYFITHIPVDENNQPYKSVDDVPVYYSAVLKIDHTNLTDDNWTIVLNMMKDGFNKSNKIKVHPKRDHKNQFRIQCSIDKSYIEDRMCKYDSDVFKINGGLNYIKSFDEFNEEIPLWEKYR